MAAIDVVEETNHPQREHRSVCRRSNRQRLEGSRRVRFAPQDSKNSIGQGSTALCRTHVIERCQELGGDPQDLWWTAHELKEIELECINTVNFFRHNQAYQRLLLCCYYCLQKNQHKLLEACFNVMEAADRARGLEIKIMQSHDQEGYNQPQKNPPPLHTTFQKTSTFYRNARTETDGAVFAQIMGMFDAREAAASATS